MSIEEAVRSEWAPDHNFLFTHNNLPQYVAFNRGLSYIALFLIAVPSSRPFLRASCGRTNPGSGGRLVALGRYIRLHDVPPSMVLYKTLPEMRYVEFPWRWLSPLCVVGAFLVASALSEVQRQRIALATAALIVAAISAFIIYTTNWDTSHYLEGLVADAHSATGYPIRFGDWSNPLGSQLSKLNKTAPLVAAAEPDAGTTLPAPALQIQVEQWKGQRKAFSVTASRPLLLKLRLLAYPAWQASLDGKPVPLQTDPDVGQMLVPIPAGSSRVEVAFGRTWDRTLGNIVSIITLLTCVPLMLWLRKRDTEPASGRV